MGRDYNKSRNFSNEVAHEIDQEVRKIINDCYTNAKQILKKNQTLLKSIADALLEHETITKEQIDYLVEHGKLPDLDADLDLEKEKNLSDSTLADLKAKAKEKGIKGYTKMSKEELIKALEEK